MTLPLSWGLSWCIQRRHLLLFWLMFVIKVKQMVVKFEIEKFNVSVCRLWKMKMKAILRKENCLEAIGEIPENVEDKKWEQMDGDVIVRMYLAVAYNILLSIS